MTGSGGSQSTAPMNRHGYRTIVADPPWPLKWTMGTTRVNGRHERHRILKRELGYKVMSIEAIAALPVGDLAEDDAALFLWIPDQFLIEGDGARVVRAWGFEPGRVLLWWAKRGYGLGTFPRPQHEALIVSTRGSIDFASRKHGSVQEWKLPYENGARKHSAKPDGAYDLIEAVSPGPYVELFARRARFGWDYWGDESLQTVELTAGSSVAVSHAEPTAASPTPPTTRPPRRPATPSPRRAVSP